MDMSASCVAELLVRVTDDQRCHVTLPRQNNRMFGFFWYVSVIQPILGDPGAVSRVERKGATKVFKYGRKSPWVPTLTEPFPKIQTDAGS